MKTLLKIILAAVVLGALIYAARYQSPQRKAFEASLAAAQQGDVKAQLQLAKSYLTGTVVKPDLNQAITWYEKATAQGDAAAAYELAELYLSGEQIPRDIVTGVSYLKLAASKDYAPAQYALGRLYQTGTDSLPAHIGQAIWWWLHAADQADADAQAALEMQQQENPDIVSQVQTLYEAHKKAQVGQSAAALQLAQAYQNGTLLEKNEAQAFATYQIAASDEPQAQYALYEFYSRTDGPVPQDMDKALEYLQQAANGGLAQAQYVVGDKIYQIAQTPQEYTIAAQWFDRAAAQNHAGALYMQGLMSMQGQGKPKNIKQALLSFKQAAELGYPDAQYVLGQSYLRGLGQKPNKTQAKKWLRLAQDNGHEQAAELLTTIR